MNNSAKYTNKKNCTIFINQEENDTETIISLQDIGIGMSKQQIERVFYEFYTADISWHDFNSSGLGISISKRIIEMHNGKIWAESPGPGKGSTYYSSQPKNKSS